jgi:hypothetical protein
MQGILIPEPVESNTNNRPFTFSNEDKPRPKRLSKRDKENNSIQHNINNNLMKMYKKEMHSVDNIEKIDNQTKGFSSSFSFTDFRHPKSYGIVPHKSLEGRVIYC